MRKLCLFLMASSSASGALAQSATAPAEDRFNLSISVRDSWDSNSLRGSAIRQNRPDASKSDFTLAPTVSLDVARGIGRHSVFVNAGLGYTFYDKNSYLNRERLNFSGGANLQLIRNCLISITGDHQRRQTELADFGDALDPENVERFASAGINTNCQSPTGITGSMGYRRSTGKNSAAIRRSSNYVIDGFDASVGLSRPALGSVSAFVQYTDIGYAREVAAFGGVRDGAKIYSGGVRYQRDIGARLRGGGSLGYSFADQKVPGVPNFKGINYGLSLSYDNRDRLRANANFSRSVQQSGVLGSSLGINRALGVNVEYSLTQNIRMSGGVTQSWRRQTFSSIFLPGQLLSTRDKTFTPNFRIRVAGAGPIGLSADVSHERRRSDNPFFDYNSTRFGVTASYVFRGTKW